MIYTPYDWTQNLQSRREYVEDQLKEGSPVVGISYQDGVLLLTIRRTQDKLFEIYDRLAFSGVGRQADLENIRLAAIDFAHREGFTLSPEDVTAQRVVGVALSPTLKRGFGDFMTHPFVVRALFAELGRVPAEDLFYILDFEGEFTLHHGVAAVAGNRKAEEEMQSVLQSDWSEGLTLDQALALGLQAWTHGRARSLVKDEGASEEAIPGHSTEILRNELMQGSVEAIVLERNSARDNTFRRLRNEEIEQVTESAVQR